MFVNFYQSSTTVQALGMPDVPVGHSTPSALQNVPDEATPSIQLFTAFGAEISVALQIILFNAEQF